MPGDEMKTRIAKYYGMTVGFLFYGEGQKNVNREKENEN